MPKPFYVFDLDGTLADNSARLHHITGENKDWDAYTAECKNDKPITPVINTMLTLLKGGAKVEIWTGRNESARADTLRWLRQACGWYFWTPVRLVMRPDNDYTSNEKLKLLWLLQLDPPEYEGFHIGGLFDDQPKTIQAFRDANIPVFDVGVLKVIDESR